MALQLWRLNGGKVTSVRPVRAAPYILPDGWIVEEVPRRDMDYTDKVMSYLVVHSFIKMKISLR